MADHGDKERLQELMETVMGMLIHLQHMLQELPIPVVIPEILGVKGPNPEAIFALDRARDLIEDEPMGEELRTAHVMLILEWFTAYELLVIRQMAGPAPWRLDAAAYAVERFSTLAEAIEDGELDES
ncbi:hypothetical protein [Streptomyces sp. NPDC010273]|uniref:hypothetical protein n=1 Tax=Streptomyces sp. NPDC010273 TaxID=3364829 RepID=UPI0036E36262